MDEGTAPPRPAVVDPLVKAGIGPHATRPGFLCVSITGELTGLHHFSANVQDWAQLAGALLRMAEPTRTVPVPPAAIEPDELEGAADYAVQAIADWELGGGSPAALAMAVTAHLARRIEAERGRQAAVELFAALAEMVRTAPPLAGGDDELCH